MKDLYTRLGNSILRAMREESSSSKKGGGGSSSAHRSSAPTKSPIPDLKRALRKEVNYTNQQVYEQLMRDVNASPDRRKGPDGRAETGMKKIVSFVLSFPLLFGFLLLMLVALIAGIVGGSQGDSSSGSDPSASGSFPEMVEVWRQNVLDCATEFEIPEYTDVLLAIMQGESGGEGLDIMQASEGEFNTRFPNVPNGITDPQYSIECGVQEFKKAASWPGSHPRMTKHT